jgi:hypothetical protein
MKLNSINKSFELKEKYKGKEYRIDYTIYQYKDYYFDTVYVWGEKSYRKISNDKSKLSSSKTEEGYFIPPDSELFDEIVEYIQNKYSEKLSKELLKEFSNQKNIKSLKEKINELIEKEEFEKVIKLKKKVQKIEIKKKLENLLRISKKLKLDKEYRKLKKLRKNPNESKLLKINKKIIQKIK